MIKNKGFTLIELLVVVAVIGILAAIVIGALSKGREKSADTGVKATLGSAPAQAEIYAAENSFSYSGICTSGNPKNLFNIATGAAKQAGYAQGIWVNPGPGDVQDRLDAVTCNETSRSWAIEVPMNNKNGGATNMWCVDSKGYNGPTTVSFGQTTTCVKP